MWVKTTRCKSSLSFLNKKLQFTIFCTSVALYQYAGYNPLSFSRLFWMGATTPLALVLADPFTCTQVPAYRMLQSSLFLQLLQEGSFYPLDSCTSCSTSMQASAYNLLSTSRDHISYIFRLDTPEAHHNNLKATIHQIFILDPYISLKLKQSLLAS